jgi:hypothetical protein
MAKLIARVGHDFVGRPFPQDFRWNPNPQFDLDCRQSSSQPNIASHSAKMPGLSIFGPVNILDDLNGCGIRVS